jgi:hypothetical protein
MQVLTESGYRCAVPTCRTILALDIHHIVEVSENGPTELSNLLALCPTCHALYHRGDISRESIYAWKGILVSLTRAFDFASIDELLFLDTVAWRPVASEDSGDISIPPSPLYISGDGVLKFSRLIVSGLVQYNYPGLIVGRQGIYHVSLTPKGKKLVEAWKSGDRQAVAIALGKPGSSA